jgi:peptidoglycan DL-endopeptidase CwlO
VIPIVPTPRRRRSVRARLASLVGVLAVAAVLLTTGSVGAAAAPTTPPNEGKEQLRANLDAAAAGYVQAEAALDASRLEQIKLTAELGSAEAEMATLRKGVAAYAAEAYKSGRLGTISALVNSTSPGGFLSKASALDRFTQRDQGRLVTLTATAKRIATIKAEKDAQVAKETELLAEQAKRKTAAEKALAAFGSRTSRGYINPNSPQAAAAPRNADGSWPPESCTIDDPTTSGCITPRTLHAMNEAKANSFSRYVSCYRSSGGGDHPKGKACDFAANSSGFANSSASGGDKTYGDNLASFFIVNAKRLGVTYVIWYCNIWISGGWKTYTSAGSNCGDSPAGDHTNHVHLSMI